VDVTGWSVQYASATGATWQVTGPLAGTVPPGGYYLVQEAAGTGGGNPLPTPDAIGTINMSSSAAKVALVNTTTALSCGVPPNRCIPNDSIIDFVGYGTTATDWEGSGPTLPPSNTSSVARAGNGCTDTDDNASDFQVTTTITPRNSASPANPCAGGGTPTNTITPGGPTNTVTRTYTPSPTFNSTSGVLIYMLHYTQYDTTTVGIGDEGVRLINTTGDPILVSNWRIENGIGNIQMPSPVLLQGYGKIWIANRATTFRNFFGFSPDFEYGADTDPNVPQATATANYSFVDGGGVITLRNGANGIEDTLVYKGGSTSSPGWSGPSVQPYLPSGQPAFTEAGQIFYRKLDQASGMPVPDTNTKDDWAQDDDPTGTTPTPGREYDDVNSKRLLRPGWALTDPRYEDMFSTKIYTDANVTTKFLVDPDNSFDAIRGMILQASQTITIETYEWHNRQWVQDIIDARNRGVQVHVFLDGNPCCANVPDDETLWSAQQWEAAGIPVYFFSGTPGTNDSNYRHANVHAKIMVVDRQWVITGSDNFAYSTMPSDDKANGTAGSRGAMIITNAPDVVAYTLRMTDYDCAVGRYNDLVRYPGMGTPPPGWSPTPFPDMVGYTVIKPTPLVVTETENIEIVQSPDNALRDADSLIGMVNKAGVGDQVMVVQQYERKFWETSTTDGPNPRLEAYIRAARRGANVRILLDGFFEGGDCSSSTHNPATVAYVNGLGLPNLQARVGAPTSGYPAPTGTPASSPTPSTGNIHNKMVLVSTGGGVRDYVHVTSINGSLNSSKNNREYGLQVQSNAAFLYYRDVFDVDWTRGYVPCGGSTATPTPVITGTPPTATPTSQPCNYLVNGDFETANIAPWTTTTPGITAQVVTEPANGGEYAVAVTSVFTVGNGGSQGIQQNINDILGGATYRVSASVLRGASNIASARIRITWYPCPNQGCAGTNDDMILGNNSPNWQTITALKTAPATAMSAKFKPVFYTSDGNPATIYFDDLIFDCNGNPTATPGAGTGTPGATLTPTGTAAPGSPTLTFTITATANRTNTVTVTPTAVASQTPTRTWTPSFTPGTSPTPTATCEPSWRIVDGPDTGSGSYLYGVASPASNDMWAVGKYYTSPGQYRTLVEHWDGSGWTVVASPNVGSEPNSLKAVAAVSTNNVWAVGAYGVTDHILLQHWDGTSWSIVNTPVNEGALNGVAAVSANDVWAVGQVFNGTINQSLALHWNGSAWGQVSTPNPGGSGNTFLGVAALSAGDVWAVGYYRNGSSSERALIEHWNGSQWRVSADAYFGTGQDYLYGVAALSASDVWAVGYYADGTGDKTLVERWNGGQWTLVPGPDPGANTGKRLMSVSALSSNDIWAAGSYFDGTRSQTLTSHWNGAAWNVVPSPNGGTGDRLLGVSALTTHDLWAVGSSDTGTASRGLIEQFSVPCVTGTATPTRTNTPTPVVGTPTRTPTPSSCNYTFIASTGTMVGGTVDTGNHCDDCTTAITLPFTYSLYEQSFDTAMVGANGFLQFVNSNTFFHSCLPGPGLRYTILAQFDDMTTACATCGIFTAVSGIAPNRIFYIEWKTEGLAGMYNFELRLYEGSPNRFQVVFGFIPGSGLAAVVGVQKDESNYTQYSCMSGVLSPGLKLSFVQGCTDPTHTPTYTSTPTGTTVATRTFTPLATVSPAQSSTPAVTASPTSCVMSFSDVHTSDYFYVPVQYLFCRGVISGYADGTFRPFNDTTRGQLSKIVVLARGWELQCPTNGHFSDVPPSDPFFCYIETAYARGIISGYADGTFRPGNNITRGQLSKVVVLAMGWVLQCPTNGHFSDVPPDQTFYCHIETAFSYGIIAGYADGTFRPGNNATRGQISQIVYRAVTQRR
jgi:phosphatidylserine/phosphatidylglycerophosphate/cardiolipin synthase-like enzyme